MLTTCPDMQSHQARRCGSCTCIWPEDWPDAPNVSCAAPPATNGVDVADGPKLRTDIAEMTTDKQDPVDEARAQRRMLACLHTPHRWLEGGKVSVGATWDPVQMHLWTLTAF